MQSLKTDELAGIGFANGPTPLWAGEIVRITAGERLASIQIIGTVQALIMGILKIPKNGANKNKSVDFCKKAPLYILEAGI